MSDDALLNISKSILYIAISVLMLIASYIALNNPSINYAFSSKLEEKAETIRKKELAETNERNAKLKEWRWSELTDVAINNEKYPLVIIRSGFKVIKINDADALIGWKMDIINTSRSSRYYPNVAYSITDVDGFHIASSSETGNILESSFGEVQGTMSIPSSDLERLSNDDWTISIGDWSSNERSSKGKRYERMAKIVADDSKTPYWVGQTLKDNPLNEYLNNKWKIIKTAMEPKEKEIDKK